MGIGPIPITAIWEWEDRHGITDAFVRDHVEAVIAAIDATTLRRANKPDERPTKATAEPPKSPARRRKRQ